jgi:hypothetical protein
LTIQGKRSGEYLVGNLVLKCNSISEFQTIQTAGIGCRKFQFPITGLNIYFQHICARLKNNIHKIIKHKR